MTPPRPHPRKAALAGCVLFCGRHLLAAKLRPANLDSSAGALEEVERIVHQIRWSCPDSVDG
jgi:hypothetical protein